MFGSRFNLDVFIWISAVSITICHANIQCGNTTCHSVVEKCINSTDGDEICACPVGFMGYACDIDRDECAIGKPCGNRGYCNNTVGTYRCGCLEGWSGQHCHNRTSDSDVIECLPGWTGAFCRNDINECLSNSSLCGIHQHCVNKDGDYSCECDSGWEEDGCIIDINECETIHPCQNGGHCSNNPGNYLCTCKSGWEGSNCTEDLNECETLTPCENGGRCINADGNYSCSCKVGWTGVNCTEDLNECETLNPCQNDGHCNNIEGNYSCTCPNGWTGVNCTEDLNECETLNPCQNGGHCSNSPGNYSCTCNTGLQGIDCSEENKTDKSMPLRTVLIIGFGGLLSLGVITGTIVFVIKWALRRKSVNDIGNREERCEAAPSNECGYIEEIKTDPCPPTAPFHVENTCEETAEHCLSSASSRSSKVSPESRPTTVVNVNNF